MDATFWALIGLILFLGVAIYYKVPAMVTKALDDRSNAIRNELTEARRMREEAQRLLSDTQKKRRDAEADAEQIVAAARREAENLAAEAERKTTEYVERRTALAEQKIAQAETQAVAEVKAAAVDVATAAAAHLIGQKVSGETQTDMFRNSLGRGSHADELTASLSRIENGPGRRRGAVFVSIAGSAGRGQLAVRAGWLLRAVRFERDGLRRRWPGAARSTCGGWPGRRARRANRPACAALASRARCARAP